MGRGSKTYEAGVKKTRTIRESVGSGSSVGNEIGHDECLFSFTGRITVPATSAAGIKKVSIVVLVPHHAGADSVDIFIDSRNFGIYTGKNLPKILSCISQGYVYEGNVTAVQNIGNNLTITFQLKGVGR